MTHAPLLSSYIFLSELERLTIEGVASPTLTFTLSHAGQMFYTATLYPDADGTVTIYALDKIISLLPGDIVVPVSMTAGGVALGPEVVNVVRCSVAMDMPAGQFITTHFLTGGSGRRVTAPNRHEALTAYCPQSTAVEVEREYYDPATMELSTVTGNLSTLNGWGTVDVSPSQFAIDGKQLVSYTVKCGDRRAEYFVKADKDDHATAIMFRNRFNAWETITLSGLKETTPAVTRSQAQVGGRLVNYDVDTVVSHKIRTGPLRRGTVPVALDLAAAKEAYLLNADGSAGDEIVVTDCDMKHNDSPYSIPDFSITFRRASKYTDRMAVAQPPRLFDSTFDATYE